MTQEIARYNEQDSFLAAIERMSANPDVDVSKIEKIIEMQERIIDKNAEQSFNEAMVAAQSEMPVVPRDAKNQQTNSRYSKYETVLKYTKPVYTRHGFSLLFYEGDTTRESNIRVCVDVMHRDGHTKTRFVDVPIDDKGIKGTVNKTMTHAKGSSLSYGKSYLIRMVFNIPTDESDDDGNAAGSPTITAEQEANIDALMSEVGANKKKFLTYFKIDSVGSLPASQYNRAIGELERKRSA